MSDAGWYDREDIEFAKVTYRQKDGYVTQAYIDVKTGNGENKHTGEPVHVEWSDEEDIWLRTDDIEWTMDGRTGIWLPKMPEGWTPARTGTVRKDAAQATDKKERLSGKTNGQNAR